ncbi:MAG: LexA repressor [bacterium]|nr:MAG: LexA repressor [bacterium]
MIVTKRQKELLNFISSFIAKMGYAPSILEIQIKFRINSSATVHQHLKNMEEAGLISRVPNRHRSIEVLYVYDTSAVQTDGRVPVMGAIAAGYPIESYPDRETEMVSLPEEMAGGGQTYILRVRGDSMIGDHILDGDMVIVRKSETANPGQTVVALIDGGETTLKRYYPEGGRIRLQPANPDMEPMLYGSERVLIQGIVIGILRKFNS